MYPQLFNQAQRLAPMLSRLLSRGGTFATPLWKASQIDAPDVNATPLPPQVPGGPQVPRSTDNSTTPTTYSAGAGPRDPAADGLPAPASMGASYPAASSVGSTPFESMQWPFGPIGAPSQAQAASDGAGVPLPMARPAEAPQDTGFFMRNALLAQDPLGGGYIDPTGAASVSGPDLIQKMMGYLHRKV